MGVEGPVYPGTCREVGLVPGERLDRDRVVAARFRVAPGTVSFDDLVAGRFEQDVAREVGDFVIRRADGVCWWPAGPRVRRTAWAGFSATMA